MMPTMRLIMAKMVSCLHAVNAVVDCRRWTLRSAALPGVIGRPPHWPEDVVPRGPHDGRPARRERAGERGTLHQHRSHRCLLPVASAPTPALLLALASADSIRRADPRRCFHDQFCLLKGVIPPAEVEAVKTGFYRARAAHQKANEGVSGMVQPEITTLAIEKGLAAIQSARNPYHSSPPRGASASVCCHTFRSISLLISAVLLAGKLTDPNTSRTEAIALVDDLAASLRTQGITELNEPSDPEAGPPPLPTHEIAYFPEFSKHIADPLLTTVIRNVLDPHVRVYQVEFGKTIAGGNENINSRGWHTDPPHDLSYAPGAIAQPFPDVCMSLVTVWYLSDVDGSNGGTWVLPGSHMDPRNPRGPTDGIDPGKPIPGEFQISAPAGSVLVQDTRMWHSMAANPSANDRVGCVVRYAPWCKTNLIEILISIAP